MKRLIGLDSVFLYNETPNAPQHTMSVSVVDAATPDGDLTFELFRETLHQRLRRLEPLRYQLVEIPFGMHHPMWQKQADVDLDYHIRRVKVPDPGSREELDDFIGRVASTSLDRSRPLWELYFVEGLAAGRKVAVIGKVHQALADAVAWGNLFSRVVDETESATVVRDLEGSAPPSNAELVAAAGRDYLDRLQRLPGMIRSGAAAVTWRLRLSDTPPELTGQLDPPPRSLNHYLSSERIFASTWLPLAELEEASRLLGATQNDVVLAAAAGALRELMLRYERRANEPIVAAVPVVSDASPDRISGTAISTMLVSLPVHIQDPIERVRLTTIATQIAKRTYGQPGPSAVGRLLDLVPPVAARAALNWTLERRRRNQPFNVIVSNTSGPRQRVRIAGAEVTELWSVGPLAAESALNIAVGSYADRLGIAVLADGNNSYGRYAVTEAMISSLRQIGRAAKQVAIAKQVDERDLVVAESAESMAEERSRSRPMREKVRGGADKHGGPEERIKGVVEDVKGKAKEAVGSVTGRTPPPRDPGKVPGEEVGPGAPRRRHLHAELPERVQTAGPLSLVVMIKLAPTEHSSPLDDFVVPAQGATVTVIVSSPGLVPLGDLEQDIHVPANADSERHRFGFRAGRVGLHDVFVDAYNGGTHLGTVRLQVQVALSATTSESRVRVAELSTIATEPGEVTLQVRRVADGYRFQMLGDTFYQDEEMVMGESGAEVSQLVAELNRMAAAKSDYATTQQQRIRLKNLGIGLWTSALPQRVQEQFWDLSSRIKMFTIVSDRDIIPWELLYPMNGDNDNGFLAEQFPVVRRTYAIGRVITLPIDSAAYIVPPASPVNAMDEVSSIRSLLGAHIDRGIYSELSAVHELMLDPRLPSILHFACHNTFSGERGASIPLEGGRWRPTDLNEAVAKTSLASGRPLVFLNACRSAGEIQWFAQMSGWATSFMRAGAGAFIGSLWAVRSSTARTFAEAFYTQFIDKGQSLGTSSWLARQAVKEDGGDPTWLAYSVYGNAATVASREKAAGR